MQKLFSKSLIIAILAIISVGCGDDGSIVVIKDDNITHNTPPCLSLEIYPYSTGFEKVVKKSVSIEKNCRYRMQISTAESIHCNSSFNAPLKSTSNFPNAYLRIELRRGMDILATYYKDFTSPPDEDDLKKALQKLRSAGVKI